MTTFGLVDSVRETEKQQRDNGLDYDEIHVRQSIVHTREDLVNVYDQLCKTKSQIEYIKNYSFITMIAVIVFVVKDLFF